ncbi:MAG: RsmB/NOP family class I SAM-dependent RNA methyltransferase [Planctomycetota bacterium]|nr:MAG: RsmB/NOP family class I SAM-dependent RNA methyltransferase [Planctomycetota bacterium]
MFDHRRALIPDFEAFLDAVHSEPDLFLRANALRMPGPQLAEGLRRAGLEVEPLPFSPHALRVRGLASPGATLEHMLGLYHVQGATSMLAPLALDVRPGHRVLDLCAAPGSKTTQIAELLAGRGWVLANDPYLDRLAVLKHHVERLGHTSVAIAHNNGAAFANGLRFDRVLVDAPCSGEGRWRLGAAGAAHRPARAYTESEVARLHALQRTLLRRAANLVEPGGRIVYSTCTYAPEENEAVVADVLRERPDLQLEPLPPELGGEPGLTVWGGRRFGETLALTRRHYPHRSWNASGFFIARLRRDPDAAVRDRHRHRPLGGGEHEREAALRESALAYLHERFGLERAALAPARPLASGRTVWLCSPEMPHPRGLERWRVQNPGLRLVRDRSSRLKPTSTGLVATGSALRRAVLPLTPHEFATLLAGQRVARAADAPEIVALQGGYAAAQLGERVVGCVFVRRDGIASQIPRDTARRVREALFVLGPRLRWAEGEDGAWRAEAVAARR